MTPLITGEEEIVEYYAEFDDSQDFEVTASFNVFKSLSWDGRTNQITATELYMKVFAKYDGDIEIACDTLDISGKFALERHKHLLDAIWQLCKTKIKNWDEVTANS
jgi:hypothetical protein